MDYDHIIDEELLRIELRKTLISVTQKNDLVETLLENPDYRIVNGQPVFEYTLPNSE